MSRLLRDLLRGCQDCTGIRVLGENKLSLISTETGLSYEVFHKTSDVLLPSSRSCVDYTPRNFLTCTTSVDKPSTSCVRSACPKLSTRLERLVISLTGKPDLLQSCPNNFDADLL